MDDKSSLKRAWSWLRDHFKWSSPNHIFVMGEAVQIKFGIEIDHVCTNTHL